MSRIERCRQAHPERHRKDREARANRQLPKLVVDAMCQRYREGFGLYELERLFHVSAYTIRVAMERAGVKIRPPGRRRGPRKGTTNRMDPDWEAKADAALAAEERRRAARMARLRRRCECGGIVAPDVAHRCGRVA